MAHARKNIDETVHLGQKEQPRKTKMRRRESVHDIHIVGSSRIVKTAILMSATDTTAMKTVGA